jgi:hypothetical protein
MNGEISYVAFKSNHNLKTFKLTKEKMKMKKNNITKRKKIYIDKILQKFKKIRKTDENKWKAQCPVHNDKNPSLSITVKKKNILLKCHAGCETKDILSALGLNFSDLNLKNIDKKVLSNLADSSQHCNGCSLELYAKKKKIPVDFLRELGLQNSKYRDGISLLMPYLDDHGNLISTRYRTSLTGENKFRWKNGSSAIPYGLQKLKEAEEEGYVIIVEGESDCHTLWYKGFPAIGLPGASTWKEDRDAKHFANVQHIYVVHEQDQGGEALINKFKSSSLLNRIKVITLGKYKDPSELYLKSPKKFRKRFRKYLESAVSLSKLIVKDKLKEKKESWKLCKDIADSKNILNLFVKDISKLGVVGEKKLIKVLYLALTSRFLDRPVSIVIKGGPSTGKSFVEEKVLSFFPDQACYKLTASSEKSMIYSDESFKHRFVTFFEASGINKGFQNYIIRTLLSEGYIKYEVTEKSKDGEFKTRNIIKEGPTGLITTTTKISLHNENETRYLSFQSDDTAEQTKKVLEVLAEEKMECVDFSKWRAFQVWLEHKIHQVKIPYRRVLWPLVDPRATRIRRDFKQFVNLIKAHAIIHQRNRKLSSDGKILANFDDYCAVHKIVSESISAGAEASVSKQVKETVLAVKSMKKKHPDRPISVTDIAKFLKIHKSTAKRRVDIAIEGGYLRNREDKIGMPADIVVGDPLPSDRQVFPKPYILLARCLYERNRAA